MSFLSFLRSGVNLRVAEQIARLRTDVDAFSQHVVFAFAKTTFHHSDFCLCFLLAPYRFRFEHRGALSRRVALVPKRARLFARRFRLRARRFASLRARSIASDASRLSAASVARARSRSASAVRRARSASRASRRASSSTGSSCARRTRRRRTSGDSLPSRAGACLPRRTSPGPAAVGAPGASRSHASFERGGRSDAGSVSNGGDERVVLGVVVPHRERARGTRIARCVASGRGARRKRHGARGCEVAARRRRSARVRSGAPNARAFTANAASAREANGVARARRAALVRATRAMRGVR